MPGQSLDKAAVIALGKALSSQGHPLVDTHIPAHDAGFADDCARAVIDKKVLADGGSGMDIDTRQ